MQENDMLTFAAEEDDIGKRIDVFAAENYDELSRSGIKKIIDAGGMLVNGKAVKANYKIRKADVATMILPESEPLEIIAQDIPLDILYEDDDVIVINKPQGMVVHPAPGNPDGTLVNALMYRMHGSLSTINGVVRPGIVHRIDKDTSGLLVVAKNDAAHLSLAEQIKAHTLRRVYNAVVIGSFKPDEGRIDMPIGRHPIHRKKMAVTDKNSKPAATNYRTLEFFDGYSLCEFRLETGRTHQIRVHAAYLGHPVLGDPLYAPEAGKNKFGLSGQCLHAKMLALTHPSTGKYMEFEAPLPDYFENVLAKLRAKLR